MEFSGEHFFSECVASGRKMRIVYAYRLFAPGRYEAEIVEHDVAPKAIGSRLETAFRVDGAELSITAWPPLSVTSAEKSPVRVDSIARRPRS